MTRDTFDMFAPRERGRQRKMRGMIDQRVRVTMPEWLAREKELI